MAIPVRALDITSALTRGNLNGVTVTFSLPVSADTATNPANYTITPGVTVNSVTLIAANVVRLHTTSIAEGQVYTLTVNSITDTAEPPNPIAANTQRTFLQTHGGLTRREFHDIGGSLLSDLTNHAKFTGNQPDMTDFSTSLETPVDVRDNYGVQFQGYVTAPVTGDYTFYVNSDDQGALFLSTDENPANQVQIATEPQWNGSRQFINGSNQGSRIQPGAALFAGALFIEAEDFDFGGGQFVADLPTGMSGPYSGGAYASRGSAGDADLDWHEEIPANASAVHRPSAGVEMQSAVGFLGGSRGDFTVTQNFTVGWCDPGDWMNYTRVFPLPARDYHVFAAIASGGADMAAQLDEVTAGAGTTTQTLSELGKFTAPATGNWSWFTLVPLRNAADEMVRVPLGGQHTLRFTTLPGALDIDYLMFVPAGPSEPDLGALRPKNISAPIHLEAGHRYYLEALMKEGGGGDNLAVTWRIPGGQAVTNGAEPIPGEFLSGVEPLVPVNITTQPQSQTVGERDAVTFNVALTGTPPYDYQWFRDGQMILGANGPSYTLPAAEVADHGAVFHVLAGNGLACVRSADAVLTITADATPPMLVSAQSVFEGDRVIVRFSEPMNAGDAADAAHYSLSGGVTINAASLGADGRTVTLTTSLQTPGTSYTLTVTGLRDTAATPNVIAAGSERSFNTFALTRGFLRHEMWRGISGVALADLTDSPRYPDAPDVVSHVTFAESPASLGDDYGARLRGFLLPPVTGDYVFYLASDDEGALFLSTDESPANLQLIAREPQWNGPRQWQAAVNQGSRGDPPANISAPVHLEAGRSYYVEARMKEGGGGDHLAVAWQKPGDPVPENFSEPIPGTYLATFADPTGAAIAVTESPHDATVADQQTATFTVVTTGSTRERFFQWQRNGVDLPGATGRSYTTPPVSVADHGAQYRCVVSVPGATVTSAAATLAVVADATPPTLVEAEGNIGLNRVTLTFSEPVNAADAADPAHFGISGGVNVLAARPGADAAEVVLTTTPQTEGAEYTVTVTGVRDQSAAATPIAAGSQIRFFAWENEEFVGPFQSWANAKTDFGAVGDGVADDTDALQAALDSIGVAPPWTNTKDVLWLPAGTYRITRTLNFQTRLSFSILGEHPATTVIKWDGPDNGVMFWGNGAAQGRMGRLTFDGSARALSCVDHKWDTQRLFATFGNEYADMVFKDAQFGIRAGIIWNDAEVEVARCHFLRCSKAGLSIESFNALDWFVRDSLFEDCFYGVSNTYGAGHYHVYDSLFLRSLEADCGHGNTSYFSIRRNTSIGSKAFFTAGYTGNPSGVTLEENVIIDPLDDAPIRYAFLGPLFLLDNVIRSRAGQTEGPVIQASENLIAVGNTFTVPRPIAVNVRTIAFDNQMVDRDALEVGPPPLPGTLPRRNRPVIEVPAGADAAQIQAAIQQADLLRGQRPVVHLPKGNYPVSQTLVIPAGSDLQLVGDGFSESSILQWTGGSEGPVLRIVGPTKATLREFSIKAGRQVLGIGVEGCDQPGSRVWMNQANLNDNDRYGLRVDRLDDCEVVLPTFYHASNRGPSTQVFGGPRRGAGEATDGRVTIFGGASSQNELSYLVDHGGSLLVQDIWYEGSIQRFLRLNGHGEFTLHGANVAASDPNHGAGVPTEPAIEVGDFAGRVGLFGMGLLVPGTWVEVTSASPELSFLGLGLMARSPGYARLNTTDAAAALHHSQEWNDAAQWVPTPDSASADHGFIRQMLAQTRGARLRPLTARSAGVTDFRLFRVTVTQAQAGMLLTGDNAAPTFATSTQTEELTEGASLTVDNHATDPDGSFNTLTYQLGAGAPPGVELNPSTGRLTWTPTEAQAPGTYEIEVIVRDDGVPAMSDRRVLSVNVTELNLPPKLGVPALVEDLSPFELITFDGDSTAAALQNPNAGDWNLSGSGYLFRNQSDSGTFAYQTVTGDFDVRVRVDGVEQHLRPETAAGLIVREALTADSRVFALLGSFPGVALDGRTSNADLIYSQRVIRGGNHVRWNYSLNGGGDFLSIGAYYPDQWVRIRREGQKFTAFHGFDGVNWSEISHEIVAQPYPLTLYVGLALSSGYFDVPTTARFRSHRNLVTGLVAPGPLEADEGTLLNLNLEAEDPDLPLQPLTFSLGPGAPPGASIDPVSGLFTWTPPESAGGQSFPLSVRVTDDPDSESGLFAEQTFTVTVGEVNAASVLPVIGAQSAMEGQPFTLDVAGTDPDLPANTLAYTLGPGAPAGLTLDAATGALAWTPDEAQGGQSFPVTVKVTDDGVPPLSSERTFGIAVAEVNTAPVLTAIPNMTVGEGGELSFTATADDTDVPVQSLTFSLPAGAPAGATITAAGLFKWTPTEAQGPGVYPIVVQVSDGAFPVLNDFKLFHVTVREVASGLTVASAVGSDTFTSVTVAFSEPISESTGTNTDNYSLDGGVLVTHARLLADGRTVVLTTGRQTEGVRYTLTISGIQSAAGSVNEITPASQIQFTAWTLGRGTLKREVWDGITRPLSNLRTSPLFPLFPDRSEHLPFFGFQTAPGASVGDFGARISGWITPPVSGEYVFYVSASSDAELYLSSDETRENQVLIAEEPQTGSFWREYLFSYQDATWEYRAIPFLPTRGDPASNVSRPVTLLAGRRYYLEVLNTPGGWHNHVSVAWRVPGSPGAYGNADLEPIRGDFLSAYVNPDGVALVITEQPQNVAATVRARAAFSVTALSSDDSTPLYQWQRNGADIPHANQRTFSIATVLSEDDGASFRCRVTRGGKTVFSDPAILTVHPATGPGVLAVTSPKPGARLSGPIEFTVEAGGIANVDSIEYYVNGRPAFKNADLVGPLTQPPFSLSWHSANVWDGFHTVQAIACDVNGDILQSSPVVPFRVANGEVTVRLISPSPGQTVSGEIDWTVESEYELKPGENRVWYLAVDGREHASAYFPTPQFTTRLDTKRLRNGLHELTVRHDLEGPTNPSLTPVGMSQVFVEVDNGRAPMELLANFKEVFLTPGETVGLAAKLAFTNGDEEAVGAEFASENPSVANVSALGLVTGGNPGNTYVEVAHAERTNRVRVVVRNAHAIPHFSKGGELLHVFDPEKSVFMRSVFFLEGGQINRFKHLGEAVREAGINALYTGFYANPVYATGFTFDGWKEFSEVFAFAEQLSAAKRLDISLDLQGDAVARLPRELDNSINDPEAAPRLRHAFEWARDSGRVIAVNMVDETNLLWGGDPAPADGRWLSMVPPISDDAFIRLMSIINSVPGRPSVSWSVVGHSESQDAANWLGNPAFSDYSTTFWSQYSRPLYPHGSSIGQTVSRQGGMDRAVLGWENALQRDKPNILLTQVGGPYYTKGGTNLQFTAGEDRLLAANPTPATVSAQIMYAVIRGMAGVRSYAFDSFHFKEAREIPPIVGGGGEWQTGSDPFSVGVERWRAMSTAFNLVKRLEPYILQPNTHAIDLGQWILTGAKRGANGRLFIAMNASETPQTINPDLSGHRTGTVIQRFRISGSSLVASILPDQPSDSLTIEPAETVIYLFTGDQTIAFEVLSDRIFDDTPIELTATSSSGLPITFSVTSGPATVVGSALRLMNPGKVTVRAAQMGDGQYRPARAVEQTFNVFKLEQAVTFPPLPDRLSTDPPFDLVATASSGLPTAFAVISGPATVVGSRLTLMGSGNVVVRASQPGDDRFASAPFEERWFNVIHVNSPPVLAAIGAKSVDEGTALAFTVSAGDPNDTPANAVTLSITGLPTGATFNPATGAFAWTPGEAQQGEYQVTFTATDDGVPPLASSETVTITVGEVNSPPVLTPIGTKSVDEGAALNFTVSAADPNDTPANTVTLSATGLPAGASFNAATGAFAWTPGEAQQGAHQVTFTATDDGVPPLAVSEVVTLTVGEVNAAPQFTEVIPPQTINEGATLTLTNHVTDVDLPANTLAFSLPAEVPAGAAVEAATGVFTWTPGEARGPGTFTLRVIVTDDGVPPKSATNEFTVTVTEVNASPVLTPIGAKSVDEGVALNFTVTATDPNDTPPNPVTLSATGLPTGATFDPASGAFAWTPGETQQGSHQVTFTATDNGVPPLAVSEVVTLTVAEVNAPPVLTPIGNRSVEEGARLTFTVSAGDPDDVPANAVTLAVVGLPLGATFDPATGVFAWTPVEAQQGARRVTFTATDDGVPPLSVSEAVDITIHEVNAPPVLTPIGVKSVDEGAALNFTVTAADPNDTPANTVTLSATGLPVGATFNPATGEFAWTPGESQQGDQQVTFTVTDNGVPPLAVSETVTITVAEVNTAPQFTGVIAPQTVKAGETLTLENTVTDADLPANAITFSLAPDAPAGAAVNAATGQFTWTPSAAQAPGTFTIQLTATDDGTPPRSATREFTVTVPPLNQPPTVTLTRPVPGTTLLAPATVQLAATAADPDGTVAKVEFFRGDTRLGEDATPPFEFELTGLVAGEHTFTARATDDAGATATTAAAVTLTVAVAFTEVEVLADGTVHLELLGEPGAAYEVQTSPDLSAWTRVADATAGPAGAITHTDTPPPGAQVRFYRVVRR